MSKDRKEERKRELEKTLVEPFTLNTSMSPHDRVKAKIKARFKVEEILKEEFPEKK